jgi:hypothetical protein
MAEEVVKVKDAPPIPIPSDHEQRLQRIQGRLDSIGKGYMTISEPRRYANYYREDVAYLKEWAEKWQGLLEKLVRDVNEGDPDDAFLQAQKALKEAHPHGHEAPKVSPPKEESGQQSGEGGAKEEGLEEVKATPPKRRGRPPKSQAVKDLAKEAPKPPRELFKEKEDPDEANP